MSPASSSAGTRAAQSAAPALTLDSPSPESLTSAGQPTFSGSAGGGSAAPAPVTVRVYSGFSATGLPLQSLTATTAAGRYAVAPDPGLADGVYTAQAELEGSPPGAGFSPAVTFLVHNAAPAIGLDSPQSAPFRTATPTFTGTGGVASGDATTVALLVYPGSGTSGTPVRLQSATVGTGGFYLVAIAPGLADGRYTAVAVQGVAGGVATSPARTFRVKAHPPAVTIGAKVILDRHAGFASVPIACVAPAGTACKGSVLIITARNFRAVPDGPSGHLRVLFASVNIPAGQTQDVHRGVATPVLKALLRAAPLSVRVRAVLSESGARPTTVKGTRVLRVR